MPSVFGMIEICTEVFQNLLSIWIYRCANVGYYQLKLFQLLRKSSVIEAETVNYNDQAHE